MSEHQVPQENATPEHEQQGPERNLAQTGGGDGASSPPPPFNLGAGGGGIFPNGGSNVAVAQRQVDPGLEGGGGIDLGELADSIYEVCQYQLEDDGLLDRIASLSPTTFSQLESLYDQRYGVNNRGSQLIYDLYRRFSNQATFLFELFNVAAPAYETEIDPNTVVRPEALASDPEMAGSSNANSGNEMYDQVGIVVTPEGTNGVIVVDNMVNIRMEYNRDYPAFQEEWPYVQRAMIRHADSDIPAYSPSFVGHEGIYFSFDQPGTWEILFVIGFDFNEEELVPYTTTVTVRSLEELNEEGLAGANDADYTEFRTGLEVTELQLGEFGVDDQRINGQSQYLTSDSPNPIDMGNYIMGASRDFFFATYTANGFAPVTSTYNWYVVPETNGEPLDSIYDPAPTDVKPRLGVPDDVPLLQLGVHGNAATVFLLQPGRYTVLTEAIKEDGQPVEQVARYVQIVLTQDNMDGLEQYRDYQEQVDENMAAIPEGQELALTAVHTTQESGQTIQLPMFLGPATEGTDWVLIDASPVAQRRRYQESDIPALMELFGRDNEYPTGLLTITIPDNDLGIDPGEFQFQTDGDSLFGEISGVLGGISLALTIGGIFCPVLLIPAGITGAASAGFSLAENLQYARIDTGRAVLDVLSIASGLIGAASATRFVSNRGATLYFNGGQYLELAGLAVDGASTVIITVQGLAQIEEILSDDSKTREQKIEEIGRILANLVITGGLYAINVAGAVGTAGRAAEFLDDAILDGLDSTQRFQLAQFTDDTLLALGGYDQAGVLRVLDMAGQNFGLVNDMLPALAANFELPQIEQIFTNWVDTYNNPEALVGALNTSKGSRPDPANYLGQDAVDSHLEQFNTQGGAFLQVEEWLVTGSYDALPPDKFVMLRADMDSLITQYEASLDSAGRGDPSILEDGLGFNPGDLAGRDDLYVIYIDPGTVEFGMPTGNELGANSLWLPGGMTPTGAHEATLEGTPVTHNNDLATLAGAFSSMIQLSPTR